MSSSYIHDPNAVLDYQWDWASKGWLADGETIQTHTVTVAGVELDTDTATGTAVTAWLSGGTVGTPASATCRITTSQGRTDDRTIRLVVQER